jgi:predicted nuclease of restriction endonuclease-like (RecB) superfamily
MNLIQHNTTYKKWFTELKQKIRTVQLKAAVTVNSEMLQFYWELGAEIVEKQVHAKWGDCFLANLSHDLAVEFPAVKGFSRRNLELIRQWYLFYSTENVIVKQAVSQLTKIPWGHNLAIIAKCKNVEEVLYYVQNTMTYGWSRSILVHQIESKLFEREGKAVTNFQNALPPKQSDLIQQTLKDPYVFDFMTMTKEYNEHDLEKSLIDHISSFLLELGSGFAYIGNQIPLQVGEKEFFIDLLFYHSRLHCYVVIELKTVDFEPEHTGKLNFYIKAVDEKLRQDGDGPTIGIILCKSKDKLVAEYALSDIHKPIGISEYQLTQSLPENLKSSLPSIEDIEAELMLAAKPSGAT